MHQELVDELSRFAREYNLLFTPCFDDEKKMYEFTFKNQERTFSFSRLFSLEQLDLFAGPTVYFARGIIEDLKRSIF